MPIGSQMKPPNGRFLVIIIYGGKTKSPGWLILSDHEEWLILIDRTLADSE